MAITVRLAAFTAAKYLLFAPMGAPLFWKIAAYAGSDCCMEAVGAGLVHRRGSLFIGGLRRAAGPRDGGSALERRFDYGAAGSRAAVCP
ncbi:hypothetical protein GCM10028822_07840 [Hymenobacter terrigena]